MLRRWLWMLVEYGDQLQLPPTIRSWYEIIGVGSIAIVIICIHHWGLYDLFFVKLGKTGSKTRPVTWILGVWTAFVWVILALDVFGWIFPPHPLGVFRLSIGFFGLWVFVYIYFVISLTGKKN